MFDDGPIYSCLTGMLIADTAFDIQSTCTQKVPVEEVLVDRFDCARSDERKPSTLHYSTRENHHQILSLRQLHPDVERIGEHVDRHPMI